MQAQQCNNKSVIVLLSTQALIELLSGMYVGQLQDQHICKTLTKDPQDYIQCVALYTMQLCTYVGIRRIIGRGEGEGSSTKGAHCSGNTFEPLRLYRSPCLWCGTVLRSMCVYSYRSVYMCYNDTVVVHYIVL